MIGSTEHNFKMATTPLCNNIGNRKIIIIKGRSVKTIDVLVVSLNKQKKKITTVQSLS